MAIRLAIFPRLDASSWRLLGDILLDGIRESIWRDLLRRHILEAPDGSIVPTYGHDVRHMAAFRWFNERPEYGPDLACEYSGLVLRLGTRWSATTEADRPMAEALRVLRRHPLFGSAGEAVRAVMESAETLFSDGLDVDCGIIEHAWSDALSLEPSQAAILASGRIALAFRKGQAGKTEDAIADYSAVIDMTDATAEQKATALVGRGLMRAEAKEAQEAVSDLETAAKMPQLPIELGSSVWAIVAEIKKSQEQ